MDLDAPGGFEQYASLMEPRASTFQPRPHQPQQHPQHTPPGPFGFPPTPPPFPPPAPPPLPPHNPHHPHHGSHHANSSKTQDTYAAQYGEDYLGGGGRSTSEGKASKAFLHLASAISKWEREHPTRRFRDFALTFDGSRQGNLSFPELEKMLTKMGHGYRRGKTTPTTANNNKHKVALNTSTKRTCPRC